MIIDAAVIGGTDRWRRRLAGLRNKKLKEKENPTATEGQLDRVKRDLADLDALEHFALPLPHALPGLPKSGTWGVRVGRPGGRGEGGVGVAVAGEPEGGGDLAGRGHEHRG